MSRATPLLTDTAAPVNDGCEAITNAGALASNVALIHYRLSRVVNVFE